MLLKALKEHADKTTKELPDFHSVQEVKYAIDIDIHGIPSEYGVKELTDQDKPSRGVRPGDPVILKNVGYIPVAPGPRRLRPRNPTQYKD